MPRQLTLRQTALHFTASKSNLDIARKLVENKASARVKDRRGQLPLHRAAAVGSVPLIKLLLEAKSPVNATDIDGMSALHHGKLGDEKLVYRLVWLIHVQAIAEGHGDAAVELLKAGAEPDKKNTDGATALELAPDAKVKFNKRRVLCATLTF